MTSIVPRGLLGGRLRRGDLLALDAVLALLLTLLCVYAATEEPASGGAGVREPAWVSGLVGTMIGLPLVVRRRWPVAVAGTVSAGSAVALASGAIPDYAGAAPGSALAAALYLVGAAVPWRRSVTVLGVSLGGLAAVLAVVTLGPGGSSGVASADSPSGHLGVALGAGEVAFNCLLTGVAWLVGRVMRERRAYAARTAEQFTERVATEERLRVARELHDIVAHSMSLIAVKSAVANHVAEAAPQETRDALRVIEATSRGALVEMRRALGVLRTDAPYAPAPGLRELPALVERAAVGGVAVRLDVPAGADLPEGVGLSVFRIVQESLTNVVKHAAPARCRVTVEVDPHEVRVEVCDDGSRAVGPVVAGHGLLGMRERVAAHAGDVSAGPGPAGGFRVRARLRYGPAA